jgi:hypothetical protein
MGNKTSAAAAATPAAAPAASTPAAAAAPSRANLNRLMASMPAVPTTALPSVAAARPATRALGPELARFATSLPPATFFTLMNDYMAQLAIIELSRGTSGLGSLVRKYRERRGAITNDDQVVAFTTWLLNPETQRAIKIGEEEMIRELNDLASGKTAAHGLTGSAANLAIRSAKLKYGQAGGKSRRAKRRGNKKKRRVTRRRTSARV